MNDSAKYEDDYDEAVDAADNMPLCFSVKRLSLFIWPSVCMRSLFAKCCWPCCFGNKLFSLKKAKLFQYFTYNWHN